MRNRVRNVGNVTSCAFAKRLTSSALLLALAVITGAAHAAETLAAAGAKATLSVDYIYESAGSKRSEGMYDPHQWNVKRSMHLVAELAAQPATAIPTVQAIDASQTAALKGTVGKAQSVTTQMAPTMEGIQKIMAKCGDDEACISSATMKLGFGMSGTAEMDNMMNAKNDAQALAKPGALRYQAWRPTAQKGSYLIDETTHISSPDPICTKLPRHRCTRDEVRKGAGEIALTAEIKKKNPGADAGISAVEVDAVKNTLTVALPVPFLPLAYTETITTDEPEGTHDTPTPKGPQQKLHQFRLNGAAGVSHDKPLTVPLKGGWRSQSGEQVVMLNGEFGDAGKLVVRWKFAVQ